MYDGLNYNPTSRQISSGRAAPVVQARASTRSASSQASITTAWIPVHTIPQYTTTHHHHPITKRPLIWTLYEYYSLLQKKNKFRARPRPPILPVLSRIAHRRSSPSLLCSCYVMYDLPLILIGVFKKQGEKNLCTLGVFWNGIYAILLEGKHDTK